MSMRPTRPDKQNLQQKHQHVALITYLIFSRCCFNPYNDISDGVACFLLYLHLMLLLLLHTTVSVCVCVATIGGGEHGVRFCF